MFSYDVIMVFWHYDVTSAEHARRQNVHFGIRSHIGKRSRPTCYVSTNIIHLHKHVSRQTVETRQAVLVLT